MNHILVHLPHLVQAMADIKRPPDDSAERLELLQRENNLLTKQNAQLDKEVVRLQNDQEALAQRCLDATNSSHTAGARLRAKEAEVENMSAAYDVRYQT